MMEGENEKKNIKGIIEAVATILFILLGCSWAFGIKVTTNEDGETKCYNVWNHEVKCR